MMEREEGEGSVREWKASMFQNSEFSIVKSARLEGEYVNVKVDTFTKEEL